MRFIESLQSVLISVMIASTSCSLNTVCESIIIGIIVLSGVDSVGSFHFESQSFEEKVIVDSIVISLGFRLRRHED